MTAEKRTIGHPIDCICAVCETREEKPKCFGNYHPVTRKEDDCDNCPHLDGCSKIVFSSQQSAMSEMQEEGKEKATRHNSGKPKVSLVLEAREAIEGIAKVMEHGCNNHGRNNWQAGDGFKQTEICDSLLRHLLAYLSGEDIDEESGLPHVDLIAANGLILSQTTKTKPKSDDRTISRESP